MNNRKEPIFGTRLRDVSWNPSFFTPSIPDAHFQEPNLLAMFLHLRRGCLHCHLLQILRVLDRADREMAYLSMGEAHRRITDYLNRFSDADALNIFKDFNRLIKQSDNDSQFGKILVHLFRAFQSYRIGNFIDSYQAYEKPANAFIQEFRNWDTAWALPALYVIAYDIRVLAERADKELALNGKSPEKWKGAGSFLMKVFGVLALHLCRGVIRSIGTARIFDFVEFPKRDKDGTI